MAAGKLKIDIRRQAILQELNENGRVFVTELSQKLGATPVTIRTDLDTLAMEGRLERIQGGAISVNPKGNHQNGEDARNIVCWEEKKAIAQEVAARIQDGDTLFINSGTTSLAVAQALSKKRRLNVVTNSLAVAGCLARVKTIRVILLGGEYNTDYAFTYGGDAMEQLQRYQSEWSILSVDGVDSAEGLTTYHAEEALIDKMMMSRAHRVIIVADHRKIGKAGFSRIQEVNERLCLITDSGCDQSVLSQLEQTGMNVCIAQMEEEM